MPMLSRLELDLWNRIAETVVSMTRELMRENPDHALLETNARSLAAFARAYAEASRAANARCSETARG